MKGDILVIGGDFYCNLGRHQGGVTGRWCVHKQPCNRAPYLLAMLRKHDLYAVSTCSQARPTTKGGSATYILAPDASKKTQLDYVFMRNADKGLVVSCRTSFLPTAARYDTYQALGR